MKKYFVLVPAGLLLFSFSSVLGAGMKGKFGISGRGGFSLPIGDFAEEGNFATTFSDSIFEIGMREKGSAEGGHGFGFDVEYYVTDNVAIGGYFDYQTFGMDLGAMKEEMEWIYQGNRFKLAGDHHIKSFGVFGKYAFDVSPTLLPFLKLGLGIGKLSSAAELTYALGSSSSGYRVIYEGERESGMRLCVDMGGGIMSRLSGSIWITGELRYRHLAIKGSDGDIDMIATWESGGQEEQFLDEPWKDEFDFNADRLDLYLGLSFFFGG